MRKLKHLPWFNTVSLGIGVATSVVFIRMKLTGAVYVYENIQWVLWLEITLAVLYALWAARKVFR